jgi:hypothetical protein
MTRLTISLELNRSSSLRKELRTRTPRALITSLPASTLIVSTTGHRHPHGHLRNTGARHRTIRLAFGHTLPKHKLPLSRPPAG